MINYEVVKSGSSGNCVIIENIMVDCGLPFKHIKDKLYEIKVLFLTHVHSDHVDGKTLNSIRSYFPKIKIIGNYEVYQKFGCDHIITDHPVEIAGIKFNPFELFHDVVTFGFHTEINGKDIIYATDTYSLENAPKKKYDYFFIESNHDEKKLMAAITSCKGSYNPLKDSSRHLSTQAARLFYFTHRKTKEAEFIELHKSARFY